MKKMFIAVCCSALLSCTKELSVVPVKEDKKPEMTLEEFNSLIMQKTVGTPWADQTIKTFEVDSVFLNGVKIITPGFKKSEKDLYLQLLQYTDITRNVMRQIDMGNNDNLWCGGYYYNNSVSKLDVTVIIGTDKSEWFDCPVKISFNDDIPKNTQWPVNNPHTMLVYGKKLVQK